MVEHVEDLTPGGHDHAGQQLFLLQVKRLLGHRGQHSLGTQTSYINIMDIGVNTAWEHRDVTLI